MPPQYQLPPDQPVINMDASDLGESHWRRVNVGELIKTHYQAYVLLPPAGWRLSVFFTSDNQKVTGRTHYRAPASLRAWLQVLPEVVRKWYKRLTSKDSELNP